MWSRAAWKSASRSGASRWWPHGHSMASMSSPCRSAAPGEQRDARDAVLAGGVVGALGHEAVFGVLAPGLDLEAGGFDAVAVGVALHRAADAGGPQRGVAGDALGQL